MTWPSIEKVTEPGFRGDPQLAAAWIEVEVEARNPETVVLRLPQPSSPFLARTATLGILPEHLLRDMSAEELERATFNSRPVGSGPYRLDTMDSREARLVAHNAYHLGAPLVEVIRIRFFSDYPSALRAASAGQLDGLMVRTRSPTPNWPKYSNEGKGDWPASARRLHRPYLNNDQALFSDSNTGALFPRPGPRRNCGHRTPWPGHQLELTGTARLVGLQPGV
jgi:peptide/nickel transport system substrate-binding protein